MMRHWSDDWIGRPWEAGEFECVDLVTEALSHLSGRRIDLPRPHRPFRVWRRLAGIIADPVAPAAAREGDIAHMRPVGHTANHHLGVVVRCARAELHILHCAETIGTCRHTAGTLSMLGWDLHGYYRLRRNQDDLAGR